MFKKHHLYILLFFLLPNVVSAQKSSSIDRILVTLNNPNSKHALVVSHRADWRNFPENSIEAINSAIEMGVDMVEIDIAKTKDGHLVLMHDRTLDRTTDGKGLVSDYTLESLKKLHLRNGCGVVTRYKIPTLEEAMLAAKGKVLVNLDKSYDYFAEVYEVLKRTQTLKQTVVKAAKPYEVVKAEFGQYLDKVIFMPIVNLGHKNACQIINTYLDHHKPVAFELVFDKDSLLTDKIVETIVNGGSKVWINSLWASLNGGHDDDLAVTDKENSYGWIIGKGATLIQTDRPLLLMEYLETQKLHR